MFLQRLTKWIKNTLSRIISHVRTAFTYEAEGEPVASNYTQVTEHSFVSADYLLPPNWLEDARRLRPQLLTPDETSRRRPLETTPLERAEKQQLPSQSLTAGTNNQAARVGSSQAQQPPRPAPPAQPTRAIPASPKDVTSHDETADDQALHRRLMSLKHLVRLGVYNEGFASGRTPEQYHHSLGIDEYDDEMGGE